MGGFEGADHVNGSGQPLDMVQSSGHLDRLDEDYRRAARAGLRCVRESIGWRLCEGSAGGGGQGGPINLDRALRMQASAKRHGLQVLWTLVHYGLPGDLSLHNDALVPRLARFAAEVARVLGPGELRPPVYTPINEIGFLAWAASQPGWLHPPNNVPDDGSEQARELSRISGWIVKQRLARAALAAMQDMRGVDSRARFMHVEPLVHVVAPVDRPDLAALAAEMRSWQWQACDMIAGRLLPELGGAPTWLDLMGVNHYHNSQWEMHTGRHLDWFEREPRRLPFNQLLTQTWQRYGRPLVVAETSHVGCGRAAWLHDIASEVRQARGAGVPVVGLCLYPLVDRPDWNEPQQWHRSGVWHVEATQQPARGETLDAVKPVAVLARHDEPAVLAALRAWQAVLPRRPGERGAGSEAPVVLAFSRHRWAEPHQRSRELLQGLSEAGWRVVYLEQAATSLGPPRLDVIAAGPAVQVLVPYLPAPARSAEQFRQDLLQGLLNDWLRDEGIDSPLVWLDTANAWPLARALRPARVVYDCPMTDLNAEVDLPEFEAQLLHAADLVLTATHDLSGSRRRLAGGRLRVVEDGADMPHFGGRRGCRPGHGHTADWAHDEALLVLGQATGFSAGPWLGFAGGVDAHVDLSLLAALAAARPRWNFAMVGPLHGVDAAALPRAPNLHWLGPLPQGVLPALMSHWDIALLPFRPGSTAVPGRMALVWQALAGGLPVLATMATELSSQLAHRAGVHTAHDITSMLAGAEGMLGESAVDRHLRLEGARALIRRVGWQRTVRRVAQHLQALRGPVRHRWTLQEATARPHLPRCEELLALAANEQPGGFRARA